MCVGDKRSCETFASAFCNMNQDEVKPVYGGDCPWVGVKYELKIAFTSYSPLQMMNKVSRALFLPKVLVLDADGGFRQPHDLKPGAKPLFPMGGMDLKWRWDSAQSRIVIDFIGTRDSKVMPWRWDECVPTKDLKWPYFLPDFDCIGHVGSQSFEYKLTAIVDTIPPYICQSNPLGSEWQLEVLDSDDEDHDLDDVETCSSENSEAYMIHTRRPSLMMSLKQSLMNLHDNQQEDACDPTDDYNGCPKMMRSSRYLGWVQNS